MTARLALADEASAVAFAFGQRGKLGQARATGHLRPEPVRGVAGADEIAEGEGVAANCLGRPHRLGVCRTFSMRASCWTESIRSGKRSQAVWRRSLPLSRS